MDDELVVTEEVTSADNRDGESKLPGRLGRRALMLGAATGVGAAAAVVAGASPAGAANGDPVLQGEVNTCSATTEVSTSAGSGLLGTINEDQTGLLGTLGPGNTAAGVVGDVNGTSGVIGLSGVHDGVYGVSHGLSGLTGQRAGVLGESDNTDGVIGLSSAGNGVSGFSETAGSAGIKGTDQLNQSGGYGVQGYTLFGIAVYGLVSGGTGHLGDSHYSGSGTLQSNDSGAVVGNPFSGDGVIGLSGGTGSAVGANGVSGLAYPGSFPLAGNGVYGMSLATSGLTASLSAGVMGDSTTNDGVIGLSSGANGVLGVTSANGQSGVAGNDRSAGGGVGVSAQSTHGKALEVEGVAAFTRSGVATLSAAATSVVVSVPGGLTSTSHVLATLQTNTGSVAVRAAVPNTSTGKITIYFSGSAPSGTKVAWFVFG